MCKIFVLGLLLFLGGCASMTVGWTPYPAYSPQPPTDAVEVLNFAPARKYQTLGSIHTEAVSGKSAMSKAVKIAKDKGADAIIITKSEPSFLILMPWHVMDAAAIKYQGE